MSRNDHSRRAAGKRSQNGFEDWGGYMGAKRQKLADQFEKNLGDEENLGPTSDIFKGVAIYIDGYTKPSSDELRKIMRQHGGRYEHYMFKTRVTHVIATNLPDSKIKKHFKNCKVIKPEWIIDSVKAGRLLSYIPYQLYTCQSEKQQGMSSFSAFSVTRQTSTSSTLARIASMEESSLPGTNSHVNTIPEESSNNGSSRREGREGFLSENVDIGSDSDSDDNEFCRLLADSKRSETTTNNLLNQVDNSDDTNIHYYDLDGNPPVCNLKKDESLSEKDVVCPVQSKSSMHTNDGINDSSSSKDTLPNLSKHLPTLNAAPSSCNTNLGTNPKHSPSNKGMAVAGEPEFISEFYNNSRLHHLSTWKSEFKSYVNELQKKGAQFSGRERLREFVQKKSISLNDRDMMGNKVAGKPEKMVMHVDMDCFFVSVGLRKRPELRGKPVAVTHSKGKGVKSQQPGSDPQYEFEQWKQRKLQKGIQSSVSDYQLPDDVGDSWNVVSKTSELFHSMSEIASCSYEARQAGLKNGMFMGKAKTLCPDLITIPYDFEGYNEVSRLLYDIVASYTHDIEAVSCDEMLVDCTDLLADTGAEPLEFVTMLRQEIYMKTNCTASAGLGSNILQAKMATRKAKPNGQYHLKPDEVVDFMKEQSVKDIPGVGWSMSRRLQSLSVSTCGDLQDLSLTTLQKEFGPKTGQSLYKYCRGQDDRQIKLEQERKSVSAEINYGIRFKNDYDAEKFLLELSEEVHNRLKKINMKGKTVTLKLMVRREDAPLETAKFMGHGLCNNISKSSTLPLATDDSKIIAKECISILKHQRLKVQDLRGIGIQLQRLEPAQVGLKAAKQPASILKFAVAKQDSVPKTDPNLSMARQESNTDERRNEIETKKKEAIGIKSFLKKSKDLMLDQNIVNRLDSVADIVNVDAATDPRDIIIYENKSCSEVAQNVAEDLSRRKNALVAPPLPCLNLSPIVSSVQPGHASGSGAQSTPTTTRKEPMSDYFPSPSQIDPEVLQELPPDIRKQIESEMKSRKTSSTDKETSKVLPNSQEPGCSHWNNPQPVPMEITEQAIVNKLTESPIAALPSLSQLDENCFNALPEDIQNELKSAYSHRSNNSSDDHKSAVNKKEPKKLASPHKNQSPGRGKKNSPVFKVPRGRPVRGRPKKLDFISRKQPKINNAIHVKKANEVPSDEYQVEDEVITIDIEPFPVQRMVSEETSRVEPDIELLHSNNRQSVNLCGAVTITEVRALLKEWINSSPDPEQDDEEIMTNYLTRLVHDHNLEQLDLVIKFLNRHIKRLDSSAWMTTFVKILDNVQTVIKGLYGSSLKV